MKYNLFYPFLFLVFPKSATQSSESKNIFCAIAQYNETINHGDHNAARNGTIRMVLTPVHNKLVQIYIRILALHMVLSMDALVDKHLPNNALYFQIHSSSRALKGRRNKDVRGTSKNPRTTIE